MKVKDIVQYNSVMKQIIDNSAEVTPVIKFKLLGILKVFEPIVANYEQVYNEVIRKYGQRTADGWYAIVEPDRNNYDTDEDYTDAMNSYNKVMEEVHAVLDPLYDTDVDISISKLKCSEIFDSGLSTNYLLALYDLIEKD